MRSDLVGNDLVAGDAGLDIDGGFLDLNAGEVGAAAAPMVAGAVEKGAAAVVGQIAQMQHVVFEGGQRLEGAGQFAKLAFVVRVPVLHHDAVRHIKEGEAHGRFGRGREGGHHGIEEWQGDGRRTHATQYRSARKCFTGDVHLVRYLLRCGGTESPDTALGAVRLDTVPLATILLHLRGEWKRYRKENLVKKCRHLH